MVGTGSGSRHGLLERTCLHSGRAVSRMGLAERCPSPTLHGRPKGQRHESCRPLTSWDPAPLSKETRRNSVQPRSTENQGRGQVTGVTGAVGPRSLGPESGSLGYARGAGTRPLSNGLDPDPS